MESWKHLRAIFLLPGTVTVVIPGTILFRTGPDTLGLWQSVPASQAAIMNAFWSVPQASRRTVTINKKTMEIPNERT